MDSEIPKQSIRFRVTRNAKRVGTPLLRITAWVWRRTPSFLSHLYQLLRTIVGVGAASVVFGLIVEVISSDTRLTRLQSLSDLLLDNLSILGPVFGGTILLLVISWFAHQSQARQALLRSAFRVYSPAESLNLSHFNFREARPLDPWLKEGQDDIRPFFGTYLERTAVEYTEDPEYDDMPREFSEADLEGMIRDGRSFLLLDQPFAGKTLTLFQIFKRLTNYTIVIPRSSSSVFEDSAISLFRGKKVVVFLDNMATYARDNLDIRSLTGQLREVTNGRFCVVGIHD